MRTLIVVAASLLVAAPAGAQQGVADLSELELVGPDGGTSSLAALVGEPVIVHFWATWCAPCREELPVLERFAGQLEADDLVLVSIDTLGPEAVAAFLDDLGVSLETHQLTAGNAGRAFGFTGYPATIVLDGDGQIVFSQQGAVDWEEPATASAMLARLEAR